MLLLILLLLLLISVMLIPVAGYFSLKSAWEPSQLSGAGSKLAGGKQYARWLDDVKPRVIPLPEKDRSAVEPAERTSEVISLQASRWRSRRF